MAAIFPMLSRCGGDGGGGGGGRRVPLGPSPGWRGRERDKQVGK